MCTCVCEGWRKRARAESNDRESVELLTSYVSDVNKQNGSERVRGVAKERAGERDGERARERERERGRGGEREGEKQRWRTRVRVSVREREGEREAAAANDRECEELLTIYVSDINKHNASERAGEIARDRAGER